MCAECERGGPNFDFYRESLCENVHPGGSFFFGRGLLLCSPGHFCAALTTAADVFRMLDLGGRHPTLVSPG